jgi:multimeric flavodoxin WrbA
MQVLLKCAEAVREINLETELISLAGKKILGCSACYKCEDDIKCALNDDVNMIIEKIRQSDGIIIGGPIYFGTIRGDLMNLVQRIGMVSLCSNNFLKGKVGGPIVIARHGGYKRPIGELLSVYEISKMIVPKSLYKTNIIGRLPGEALRDKKGMEAVLRFAKDVAELVKRR